MKTLKDIEEAVGTELFRKWERQAEKDLEASSYWYRSSEARHAYIYGEVLRRYQAYTVALQSKNRVFSCIDDGLLEGT